MEARLRAPSLYMIACNCTDQALIVRPQFPLNFCSILVPFLFNFCSISVQFEWNGNVTRSKRADELTHSVVRFWGWAQKIGKWKNIGIEQPKFGYHNI